MDNKNILKVYRYRMKIEGAVLYLFYPSKTNPIENRHGWVILGKNSSTPKYVVCSTSYLLGHFLQINPNRLMVRKICLGDAANSSCR